MRNFKKSEFACQCGCGTNNPSEELVTRLDDARDIAGVPFIITGASGSACRCVKHNAEVGGSKTSSHLTTDIVQGTAVDIKYTNSLQMFKIVQGLLEAGFERIGVGRSFIHADVDTTKPKKVMWTYYKKH